jgi:integrase
LFKDGLRHLATGGKVQRWLCRICGYRFSNNPYKECQTNRNHQLCVLEAKKLDSQTETKTVAGISQTRNQKIKGKTLEYSFWLLKQGYAKSTIKGRVLLIKRLCKLCDIFNVESVKEAIAKQKWSDGRKENAVDAFTSFLQMQNPTWNPPQYRRTRKLPFIPTETEIDQLISACNQRMTSFLQLLKETGVRCGEACKIKWIDLDCETLYVRITPEKGSNPRILKITPKLISMLNSLPRNYDTIFFPNQDVLRKSYQRQRKRIANKLKNPRLRQISFHTFRHFKATMEYHKTKDILHVMHVLGHRNIKNTLIYTHLVNFKEDDYVAKVAHTEKEVCELIEAGYQFVCDYKGDKIFRKRK